MARSTRYRNWTFVIYPDSAPDDWEARLRSAMVDIFVSPLHDKDVNPDGVAKKAHRHVMLMFSSVKTKEQAQEVVDSVGGVGCFPVSSLRSMARYFCHLDNPDKAQYSPDDIIQIGAADYASVCSLPSDRYKIISEMMDFCVSNNCTSIRELCDYARLNRMDWFRLLCDSAMMVMSNYCKSLQWELDCSNRDIADI